MPAAARPTAPRGVAPDPEHAREIQRKYREEAPRAPEGIFDLREIYPANTDIEIEIGFGRGQFLFQRAGSAPHAFVIGIEIKKKLAYQVEQRRQQLELARVRVLSGDARSVLPNFQPDAAIARVFVSFPDPWWKKRHAKRRVLAEPLLAQIARLLRPGGELFVQTDVEERAEQCLVQLREHPAFELPESGYSGDNPYGARTNREQRAIADGVPIYRIIAVRRG